MLFGAQRGYIGTMMGRSPDFVCVGAQKAATSWLYNALRWVPGVFLPAIKELHYFSELCSVDARGFGPKHRASQIREVRVYHEAMEARTPFAELLPDLVAANGQPGYDFGAGACSAMVRIERRIVGDDLLIE